MKAHGSPMTMHLGTAYRITRKQQIDSHFGFGLFFELIGQVLCNWIFHSLQ
jgi:hypothetical protein